VVEFTNNIEVENLLDVVLGHVDCESGESVQVILGREIWRDGSEVVESGDAANRIGVSGTVLTGVVPDT
jgi:hypothetical protein